MRSAAPRAPRARRRLRRWPGPVLLALVALLVAAPAHAQRINLQAGLVTFQPAADPWVAALGCVPDRCLQPAPGSAEVTAKVLRQGQQPVPPMRIELGGWSNGNGPDVLVRFVVDGVQSPPRSTGWVSLDAPVTLDLPRDPVTNVRVEYRLRPRGAVPAGQHRTRVEFTVGSSRVEHPLVVDLPVATALRVVGGVAADGVSIAFDYAPDPLAYLAALRDRTPLRPTASQLQAVEVYTTDPRGYRVAVAVVASDGGTGLPPERLLLFGASADGTELIGAGPTAAFVPIVVPGDYGLRVDGTEATGAFDFDVAFTALPR